LIFVLFEIASIVRINSDPSSTSLPYVHQRSKVEESMPRFYFHLKSKEARIPDDSGKDFDTLNDAYKHGLKLIDKILLHVGYDDAYEWKVIVLNDQDDVESVIPFTASYQSSSTRKPNTADQTAV
jgi:hypothetical protein